MSDNARDTQFKRFAKLLLEEIGKVTDDFCKEPFDKGMNALVRDIYASEKYENDVQLLIARRAYDLVKHALTYFDTVYGEFEDIEDLTELPKE